MAGSGGSPGRSAGWAAPQGGRLQRSCAPPRPTPSRLVGNKGREVGEGIFPDISLPGLSCAARALKGEKSRGVPQLLRAALPAPCAQVPPSKARGLCTQPGLGLGTAACVPISAARGTGGLGFVPCSSLSAVRGHPGCHCHHPACSAWGSRVPGAWRGRGTHSSCGQRPLRSQAPWGIVWGICCSPTPAWSPSELNQGPKPPQASLPASREHLHLLGHPRPHDTQSPLR